MASKSLNTIKRIRNIFESSCKYATVSSRRHSGWTSDKIVKSPLPNIEIPNSTLYDYVWQNLDKWPERTCSVCAVTGRGYTYEQAFKLSNTFAANLKTKFRLRDGDTAAIMLPNIPDYPIIAMGILEAGGVISSINPLYTDHEVSRQLTLCDAKLIITLPETINVVREALKKAKIEIPIIIVKTNGDPAPEGTVVFNELSEDVHVNKDCLKKVRRNANDIGFLPYSSGTTGLPKGVELSHRNLVTNCEQICDSTIRAHRETTATHQDNVMAILPFYHIYGAAVIMFHKMSQGIKMVTMDKFQPETFLEALEKQKINVLFAAPPIILMMAAHPKATTKTFQYLETVINGAAPLGASDSERFLKKIDRDLDLRQGYGLTETSPVVTMSPIGSKNYSSVGIPLPNTDIRIVDADLNNLGPNEKGELLVRGPQLMRGYRNNPQANSESFTSDGWYRTGDYAVIDDKGLVTIADRLKELIKVKGFQVPPAELEAVIRSHPEVADAAVIGIPHPSDGEAPKAFVVRKSDAKVEAKDISDFITERVAVFKRVDANNVMFIDSIPKSAAGKILKRDLKSKYC